MHRDELLAVFQQTYRIDLWGTDWDGIDDDRAAHLAALAYQLPNDSRTRKAMDPTAANGLSVQLLREIEHNQRMWHWANTDAAKDESTAPEPITLPGEDEAYRLSVEDAKQKADDLARAFGLAI